MRLAALQVGHDNARQAARPLQPHMMAGEEELGAHIGAGLVGEPVTPPLSPLRLHRRGDDLEVGRGIGVGQDVEQFAVVREVVFDTALAGGDEAGRALGRRGLDQTNLGGRMVVRRYHDEAPALRLVDVDEEAGVGLLVDHRVRARGTHSVAAHLVGTLVLVDHGVEHGLAVGSPDGIATGILDGPVDNGAALDIADEEPVALRTVEVERVGKAAVIGAVPAGADFEI